MGEALQGPAGEVEAEECRALVRRRGRWREADPAAVWDARYDRLLYEAEAVLFVRVGPPSPA